jgi:hypothetical protein
MRLSALLVVPLALAAAAALAQNSATAPATPPPAPGAKPETPIVVLPSPPPAPPAPANEVTAAPDANETVISPPQPQVPSEPMTISPDAEYPNGFADPEDPFANDAATAAREGGDFNWGLLGLLGLFGLIPLIRKSGGTRTIYVDRDDPRRVIREEEQ